MALGLSTMSLCFASIVLIWVCQQWVFALPIVHGFGVVIHVFVLCLFFYGFEVVTIGLSFASILWLCGCPQQVYPLPLFYVFGVVNNGFHYN